MSNKYKTNRAAEILLANKVIAKNVGEALNAHYPGHAWAVGVDVINGIATIHNLRLSNEMGFILHLSDLINDPSMQLVIKSGGEFLERYSLRRGEFKESDLDDKRYDLRGNMVES